MPKISVIIPAYNAEKTIKRTLDSILNQSFSDFEVLIIDDGSKDKTAEICKEIAKADNRVKVISKENGGVSNARNLGLEKALGEYIYFCDSDDEVMADGLKSLISVAEKENADIVVGGYQYFYKSNNQVVSITPCEDKQKYFCNDFKKIIIAYLNGDIAGLNGVGNKLFKTEIIKKHHLIFDINRTQGEDWAFIFNFLMESTNALLIPNIVYKYYLPETSGLTKYKGDIAYHLISAKEISSKAINKFNIEFEKEEYTKLQVDSFYRIMDALLYYDNLSEYSNCKKIVKNKNIKSVFRTVLSIKNSDLLKYSLSKKDKLISILFLFGFVKSPLKLYKKEK